MSNTNYQTIIGLEVHVQLNTNTKMFCGCANTFTEEPNIRTCPVCLGLPGSLPVVNKEAIAYAIKIGLALNCEFSSIIKFDRKNYFYPDCPKNYQISQFDFPICKNGHLDIPGIDDQIKTIGITRAHLEEDAGKLVHESDCSLVDYNRTGTPLLEIVSEPDLRSAQEAYDYLNNLKLIISYLDVSDCDMEKGSLRCDANVSVRPVGQKAFGTKAEIKNLNSFRAVKAGIDYEVDRQIALLESGEKVLQESRLWDETKNMTFPMRSKEEAHDYRYFPEPDLVPSQIDANIIEATKKTLPELPAAKFERLQKEYDITAYEARILISDPYLGNFFEACCRHYPDTKKICNWINGALLKELNERKVSLNSVPLQASELAALIKKVDDNLVSNLAAKDVLKFMMDSGKSADDIIKEKGLAQVSDDNALQTIVDTVIQENPDVANQIKEGKESAVGFLVGQAMKKTQGKANPKMLGEIIKRRLLDA